jgi:hypothetical protein
VRDTLSLWQDERRQVDLASKGSPPGQVVLGFSVGLEHKGVKGLQMT